MSADTTVITAHWRCRHATHPDLGGRRVHLRRLQTAAAAAARTRIRPLARPLHLGSRGSESEMPEE